MIAVAVNVLVIEATRAMVFSSGELPAARSATPKPRAQTSSPSLRMPAASPGEPRSTKRPAMYSSAAEMRLSVISLIDTPPQRVAAQGLPEDALERSRPQLSHAATGGDPGRQALPPDHSRQDPSRRARPHRVLPPPIGPAWHTPSTGSHRPQARPASALSPWCSR